MPYKFERRKKRSANLLNLVVGLQQMHPHLMS